VRQDKLSLEEGAEAVGREMEGRRGGVGNGARGGRRTRRKARKGAGGERRGEGGVSERGRGGGRWGVEEESRV
jgi:hypothetical protein